MSTSVDIDEHVPSLPTLSPLLNAPQIAREAVSIAIRHEMPTTCK